MADVVDPAIHSRMLACGRGRDAWPETIVRRGLDARGFRYRLHDQEFRGRPDLVFLRRRVSIQGQRWFWHGHGCQLFKWLESHADLWRRKITGNRKRHADNQARLREYRGGRLSFGNACLVDAGSVWWGLSSTRLASRSGPAIAS